jgi:hypothetical protein
MAVSDLSLRALSTSKTILLVQLLNLSNLDPETSDLFLKNFEVIHKTRIVHLDSLSVGRQSVRENLINDTGFVLRNSAQLGAMLCRINEVLAHMPLAKGLPEHAAKIDGRVGRQSVRESLVSIPTLQVQSKGETTSSAISENR